MLTGSLVLIFTSYVNKTRSFYLYLNIVAYLMLAAFFTVVSFMFPTIGMLYLVHSTPYDIELGAINVAALKDMVEYNYRRKVELLF